MDSKWLERKLEEPWSAPRVTSRTITFIRNPYDHTESFIYTGSQLSVARTIGEREVYFLYACSTAPRLALFRRHEVV